jgi:hypothetical protein
MSTQEETPIVVLVTGGTGLVGRGIFEALVGNGVEFKTELKINNETWHFLSSGAGNLTLVGILSVFLRVPSLFSTFSDISYLHPFASFFSVPMRIQRPSLPNINPLM